MCGSILGSPKHDAAQTCRLQEPLLQTTWLTSQGFPWECLTGRDTPSSSNARAPAQHVPPGFPRGANAVGEAVFKNARAPAKHVPADQLSTRLKTANSENHSKHVLAQRPLKQGDDRHPLVKAIALDLGNR